MVNPLNCINSKFLPFSQLNPLAPEFHPSANSPHKPQHPLLKPVKSKLNPNAPIFFPATPSHTIIQSTLTIPATADESHQKSTAADELTTPATPNELSSHPPGNTQPSGTQTNTHPDEADHQKPCTSRRITPTRPNTKQLFPLYTPTTTTVTSTLRVDGIRHHLRNYPDQQFPETLVGIAMYGARVGFRGSVKHTHRPNHPSIQKHMEVIDEHIQKEIAAGRIREITLPPQYFCSPLGLTTKKRDGIQTGWRIIFDLSCPQGRSVNDGIPKEFGNLQYESFQHALQLVAAAGRYCILLKKDLKAAFRQVPISSIDWPLFIFFWRGKYYADLFLPFGLRTSPRIYNLFGEAIHWTLEDTHNWSISHYVDDFLAVFPPNTNPSEKSAIFDKICTDFGFPTEPSKDEMGTVVSHLGFEIDTSSMTATLSENKRNRAINLLTSLISRKSAPAATLEQLLGFLNHCCEVIPVGRPFLRHLFTTLSHANKSNRQSNPYRYAKITKHARRDILWWLIFLRHWSCISIIQMKRPLFEIWTDASGTKGIGGIFEQHLFSAHVPRRHRTKHINWKEMYAILYALLLWHSHWENGELLVHCDNEAVVDAVNKRSIRGPTIAPLQTLLLIAALFNINITAAWIPTAANSIADALSRHDFKRLANLGFQDYNHEHIRNTEPPIPVSTFRQKLRTFLGTASPNQLGSSTQKPSPTTSSSQEPTATFPHSQHPSIPPHIGSPTSSKQSKSKQHKITSVPSATTTSKTTFPQLTTQLFNASSGAATVYTTSPPTANDFPSPKTSSSKSQRNSAGISTHTTISTSMQPCVSDSPLFFERGSSPGSNGILLNLLDYVYPANMCHSTLKPDQSPSLYHHPKPTLSAKAQKSTSHLQGHKYALSQPSTTYSKDSRLPPPHPSSTDPMAPFQDRSLSTKSKTYYYSSESTPPNIQDTPYGRAQQFPQVEKAYPAPTSNYWAGGRVMQSTSTSTRSQNRTSKQNF